MKKNSQTVFAVCLAVLAAQTAAAEGVFETLAANCGSAFEGRVVRGPADDPWRGARLVMHIRDCNETEIRIPLHYDDNRSRIWIVSKTPTGLRLKHDHRHENGEPDETTMYGGDTAAGAVAADESSLSFHVDAASVRMFREQGRASSTENVWSMRVEGDVFSYGLVRPNLDFAVAFDLSRPVATPPPAWDQAGRTSP